MANLKEIRTRIASVSSTQKVTSAMKLVSAAKLRKAQEAIIRMRPYANKLHAILSHIAGSLDNVDNLFAQQRKPDKVLVIVIASNRGLCGAFNTNVIKTATTHIKEKYSKQDKKGDLEIITIGKKASDSLKEKVVDSFDELYTDLCFDNAKFVAERMMQHFLDGKYDRIDIVYNEYKNAAVQILRTEQFLPIEPDPQVTSSLYQHNYYFEPSRQYIIDVIIPKTLKIQFYKALLDSFAAEHGARMTSMHKATENAKDLIKELKLNYNKARQATITAEILEIVGGANALEN